MSEQDEKTDIRNVPRAAYLKGFSCEGENCFAVHVIAYDETDQPICHLTFDLEIIEGFTQKLAEILDYKAPQSKYDA